jgi:hypothetical protein
MDAPNQVDPAFDAESLLAGDIKTSDDLWNTIGQDPDNGISVFAFLKNLQTEQVIKAMVDRGVDEYRLKEASNRRRLSRFWLEISLCTGALLLIALGLRAFGFLGFLPQPLGLSDKVAIAARDLESGRMLRASDLYYARLSPRPNYFNVLINNPEGLILKTNTSVSHLKPIHFQDVLRLQVTAKADIVAHAKIKPDDVILTWSAYQPDAFTNLASLSNYKPHHAIQSGTVITCESLYDSSSIPLSDPCYRPR